MRLVKITMPKELAPEVARLAFGCGVSTLTTHELDQHNPGAKAKTKAAVDLQVSTPQARAVIEALVRAPFYDRREFSIELREPRSVLKGIPLHELTRPTPAPMLDIEYELWQFSHITVSFVIRVLIASTLLAYGMIEDNPLLMIGGLVFLPFMPLALGIGYGALDRQWKLVAQSAAAFVTATLLIAAAGAAVGAMGAPPLLFDKFPPIPAGVALSVLIGIAGGLGTADDAGHRQLIGLAAASQIALIPAWFGISLVFGFAESPAEKAFSFGVNAAAMLLGAAAVYGALLWRAQAGHKQRNLRHARSAQP
jgi:hypothetical protein